MERTTVKEDIEEKYMVQAKLLIGRNQPGKVRHVYVCVHIY